MKEPTISEEPRNAGDLIIVKVFQPPMDKLGKYNFLVVLYDIITKTIWLRRLKPDNLEKIIIFLKRFNKMNKIKNLIFLDRVTMYREYIIREIERKGFRVSPYQQARMQLKALIDIDFYVNIYFEKAKIDWAEQIYVYNEIINRDFYYMRTGRLAIPEEEYWD